MNINKTFKVNAINSNSSNPDASNVNTTNNGTLNTDSSDGGTLNTSNDGVLNTCNGDTLNTNASTDNAVETANDGTRNNNVTLTKQEISSCFILQVEVRNICFARATTLTLVLESTLSHLYRNILYQYSILFCHLY